jgi:hypothetical protein
MKTHTHTHTPGPWRVKKEEKFLVMGTFITVRDSHDGVIAGTHVDDKANARLIASAPELLAALILAVPLMQRYAMRSPVLEPSVDRILPAMISAIAQAEGNA